MTMPNFLLIGAGKSGTTSLYRYIEQHPDVYMSPVKETNFFALEGEKLEFQGPGAETRINAWSITDIEHYRSLFDGVSGEKAIGEGSPLYLYSPKAPERIRHYIPDAKLIVILRHPAERAYSAYLWLLGQQQGAGLVPALQLGHGRETISDFAEALRAEETRIKNNWEWIWHYRSVGFYYTQLKRYYDLFEPGQIQVYLYDDFKADNLRVIRDIFRFLEVDDTFTPNVSVKHGGSYIPPKNSALHTFLTQPNPIKELLRTILPAQLRKPMATKVYKKNMTFSLKLPKQMRQQLIEVYREDIIQLQNLLQRDLSKWLAP